MAGSTRQGLRIILLLIFLVLSFPYAAAPIYTILPAEHFHGNEWFNPYHDVDLNTPWKKVNTHLHSRVWWGTTDGHKNTLHEIAAVYRQLGYAAIALSNYQRIDSIGYGWTHLPCYEHGYNIQKTHQIVLGAQSVIWLDCILPQTLFIKQWILDILRPTAEITILAHPAFGRPSYYERDMNFLGNYDGIEVFNHYRTSWAHWDSALSNGIIVWAVGNDDCHDVQSNKETGVCLTLAPLPVQWKPSDLYHAFHSGKTIAVRTYQASLPITGIIQRIQKDSLVVVLTSTADSVRFVSDGGKIAFVASNTARAAMPLLTSASYIRVEVYCGNTTYALNPVVRTSSASIPTQSRRLREDVPLTLLYRLVWMLIYVNIGLLLIRR
ncbi:MAG: hypothetical protein RMK00_02215 [Bacteroidota bacterium]|nr:hypothetical protein [Candidatus Kapabacteria bacterium]MCX7936855.1 hypothetical protein [Chlorobiota bacterium]MDW8074574.1 hypothetical protein [Bacteroidota bacterium]